MLSSGVAALVLGVSLALFGRAQGSATETSDMNTVPVTCRQSDNTDIYSMFQCVADWDQFSGGDRPSNLLQAFVERFNPSSAFSFELPEDIQGIHEYNMWNDWYMPFFGLNETQLDDFVRVSLFLEYFQNNTIAVMEKKDSIVGYSAGLFPPDAKEGAEPIVWTRDMMDALRDISVHYDLTIQKNENTQYRAHAFGFIGSSVVNMVYFEESESADYRPIALGATMERGWAMRGNSTISDWIEFRIKLEDKDRPSAYEFISSVAVAPMTDIELSVSTIEERFRTMYNVADEDVADANHCESLVEDSSECNPNILPPYQFGVVDLSDPEGASFDHGRSTMMLARYSSTNTTWCQDVYPMDSHGVPKTDEPRARKNIFLLNANDFMFPIWNGAKWEANSWCDTSRNTTYIEYELYWYSAAFGMLSGFPEKDYNKENMYQGIRQWPTRNNYTAFVVSASKKGGDLIGRVQVCENVFSDTQGKDVAGCLDVSSPWNTGVFVGSLLGILVVIGVWVWGGLTAASFKAHVPDYYWYLERYQPEFLRQQEEIARARRAQKEAKKAARAQRGGARDGGEKMPLNRGEATGTSGDSLTGSDSDAQYK